MTMIDVILHDKDDDKKIQHAKQIMERVVNQFAALIVAMMIVIFDKRIMMKKDIDIFKEPD